MAAKAPAVETGNEASWAICCSGGGIRSASYCLGAMQSLDACGLLGKAKWITGVSGGGYIAASRALVAHSLPSGSPRAYAPSTPEERHLRDNAHRLAPGASAVLVGVLSLIRGALVTYVVWLAPLYAAAHAWGWLLHSQGVLLRLGPPAGMTASVTGWTWWLWPAILGVAIVLFAFWRSTSALGADSGLATATVLSLNPPVK